MLVLILKKCRPSLRGQVTRWLIQPQSGVYVGHLSGKVRDLLWQRVEKEIDERGGSAILIHPADNEQGFAIRTRGKTDKCMRDFDGLALPKRPLARK